MYSWQSSSWIFNKITIRNIVIEKLCHMIFANNEKSLTEKMRKSNLIRIIYCFVRTIRKNQLKNQVSDINQNSKENHVNSDICFLSKLRYDLYAYRQFKWSSMSGRLFSTASSYVGFSRPAWNMIVFVLVVTATCYPVSHCDDRQNDDRMFSSVSRSCHHKFSMFFFFFFPNFVIIKSLRDSYSSCIIMIRLRYCIFFRARVRREVLLMSCHEYQIDATRRTINDPNHEKYPKLSQRFFLTIWRKIKIHSVKESTRNDLSLIYDMKTINFVFPMSSWTLHTTW